MPQFASANRKDLRDTTASEGWRQLLRRERFVSSQSTSGPVGYISDPYALRSTPEDHLHDLKFVRYDPISQEMRVPIKKWNEHEERKIRQEEQQHTQPTQPLTTAALYGQLLPQPQPIRALNPSRSAPLLHNIQHQPTTQQTYHHNKLQPYYHQQQPQQQQQNTRAVTPQGNSQGYNYINNSATHSSHNVSFSTSASLLPSSSSSSSSSLPPSTYAVFSSTVTPSVSFKRRDDNVLSSVYLQHQDPSTSLIYRSAKEIQEEQRVSHVFPTTQHTPQKGLNHSTSATSLYSPSSAAWSKSPMKLSAFIPNGAVYVAALNKNANNTANNKNTVKVPEDKLAQPPPLYPLSFPKQTCHSEMPTYARNK